MKYQSNLLGQQNFNHLTTAAVDCMSFAIWGISGTNVPAINTGAQVDKKTQNDWYFSSVLGSKLVRETNPRIAFFFAGENRP